MSASVQGEGPPEGGAVSAAQPRCGPGAGAEHRVTGLRDEQWNRRFGALTLAWLAFETASGLSVYLLPFSVPNQWLVILHTAVGVVFLVPAFVYQCQHLAAYWPRPRTAIKLMGYLGALAVLVATASGLVLTAQALWGSCISYVWDVIHVVSTFALVAFAVPHVVVPLLRDRDAAAKQGLASLRRAYRRTLFGAAAATAGLFVVGALLWAVYRGETLVDQFPQDYSFKYGEARPFAPSLAMTASGGAYDSRSLAGSKSCGTAGCHQQIADEWQVSAHRWAAMDTSFQRIQEEMARQNGPESTRYCGGCHDPISLFSGTKNVLTKDLTNLAGYDEGVSCLACHSIRTTDVQGNANFVVAGSRWHSRPAARRWLLARASRN